MAPTDVIIRRAQRGDLGALGRLGATLLRVHYELDRARFMAPGHDPEGGYAWFLGSQLTKRDARVFVAERDEVAALRSPDDDVGWCHDRSCATSGANA